MPLFPRLYLEGVEVEEMPGQLAEEFTPNEDSLLDEMHVAISGKSLPGTYDAILPHSFLL